VRVVLVLLLGLFVWESVVIEYPNKSPWLWGSLPRGILLAAFVVAVIFYKIGYGMASWTVIGGFGTLVFNFRGANEKTYERHAKWVEKSLSARNAPNMILLAVTFTTVSLIFAPVSYLSVAPNTSAKPGNGSQLECYGL
jgi:hypothetical protein